MADHKNLTFEQIHVVHAFEYADATAREAAAGLVSTDVYKVARQIDNNSYWVLLNHSPVTWGAFGAGTAPQQTTVASFANAAVEVATHTTDLNGTRVVQITADNAGSQQVQQIGVDYDVEFTDATTTTVTKLSAGTDTNVQINIVI